MEYVITSCEVGQTIKEYLKKRNMSGGMLRKLKKIEDGITVNGLHQNVTYRLMENDILKLNTADFDEDINEYLEPVDLPIEIVYEDENITVVNKPYNMPTHQSLNNHGNTLANALRFRYSERPYVFRAVNRLDKDTSGLVVTANNRYYASLLSEMIKRGEVKKEYIAVVKGKLTGDGVIDAPIDRVGESIIKRTVRKDGERAITEYRTLLSCDEISVMSVTPVTGRTHQIRVHMEHIGHPIIGDGLYFESSPYISRQALHCYKMDMGQYGCFAAPIPKDIDDLIRRFFDVEKSIF